LRGFVGTFLGYTVANTWFYFLGAALISVMDIQDIIASISLLLLGNLALLFILVDETDNCFADIYSAAVSIQNIAPKARQWKLVIAVTVIGAVLATTIPLAQYEWFLLMIGGLFVPLLGVLVADYLIGMRRGGLSIAAFYEEAPKLRLVSMIAWPAGIVLYFFIINLYPNIGASFLSFILSSSIQALLIILENYRAANKDKS
jgi:purine-cytosine permease-like protein